MLVVVTVAVAMATALNLLRYEETYKRIISQRLDVTAREVALAVTTGIDLGLRLEAQGNLPAIIAQKTASQPDVSIGVQDCNGRVVVGEAKGGAAPPNARVEAGRWRAFDEHRVAVGMTVRDNLGACAANVVVEMPSKAFVESMRTVSRYFWSVGGLVTAAAAFVAIASAMIFNRRRRAIESLERDLSASVAGVSAPSEWRLSPDDFKDPWERAIVESYTEARNRIVERAKDASAAHDGARP